MNAAPPSAAQPPAVLHRSVRTSTSLNAVPGQRQQLLRVSTAELTLEWYGDMLMVEFKLREVRTSVDPRSSRASGRSGTRW